MLNSLREMTKRIHYYTGLETYSKFLLTLQSLGPAAYRLRYVFFQIHGISIPNQFFHDTHEVAKIYSKLRAVTVFQRFQRVVFKKHSFSLGFCLWQNNGGRCASGHVKH